MPGHHHSHDGCGADAHDHDHVREDERGNLFSLYLKVDTEKVQCLNEQRDGSGKDVFKPWDQRKDKEKFVESDADEELIFNIPFTGCVKLKGIIIIGGEENLHPSKMKVYKNRPHMTFDDTGSTPDQEFELQPDYEGVLEYSTKIAKFSSCSSVTLYFPSNFGAETTKVYYIGLRGDFTEAPRREIAITNYELRPNPAEHKNSLLDAVGQHIS